MNVYIVHYTKWEDEENWPVYQREPESIDSEKAAFMWEGDTITFSRTPMANIFYYAYPLEEGLSFVIKEVDWETQLKTF